jgi:hypothetical protein
MEYVVRSVVALVDLFFKAPASYIRIKLKKKRRKRKTNSINSQKRVKQKEAIMTI